METCVTRLLLLMAVVCAPVMADEPKPVTLVDCDIPQPGSVCSPTNGAAWSLYMENSSASGGESEYDPCKDADCDAIIEPAPNAFRAKIVRVSKMRCVITDGQTIADPKWSGILEREFYIECEPVTEEQ